VEVHDPRRVVGIAGDHQRRDAVGVGRRHRHLGRGREVGEHLLVGDALLLHVGVACDGLHERLPQPCDALDVLATDGLHGRDRRVDLAQDRAHAVQQRLAGERELDAVGRAPQQGASEHLLERADLPAQRRLGDVQPLGGPAEVELLGHRDERAQVAKLDRLGRLGEGHYVLGVVHAAIIDTASRGGDAGSS